MKKRALGYILVLSIVLELFTFVSARTVTERVNVALNKSVELYCNAGTEALTEYVGYEGSKMVDGSTDTFCYNKGFNNKKVGYGDHLAIIDLGELYDITQIIVRPENSKNAAAALGITTDNGYSNISTPNYGGIVAVSVNRPVASQFDTHTFTTSGDTNGIQLTNTDGSTNLTGTRYFNEPSETKYRYVSIWVPYSYGMAIQEVEVYTNISSEINDDLYVSPNGNDNNDGSAQNPFRTIARAQQAIRERNSNMVEDITVHIAGGRYELSETLDFDEEDSGTNGYNVIYQGDPADMPTLSAGTKLDLNWTMGDDGIWSARVNDSRIEYIRNLYVNETPATRASSSKLIYGVENYVESGSSYNSDGFYVNKADLGVFGNQGDIQLGWTVGWKSWKFYIKEIVDDPSNPDRVIVKMNNPEWNSESQTTPTSGWPAYPRFDLGFRVENAYELLDEPGEFYFDRSTRTLSYLPREGENMNTASVICPVLDKVLSITGEPNPQQTDQFKYVKNIQFKNLRFAHSGFGALEESDMHAYQCEILHMTNVPKGITPGAVEVGFADNVSIEDCVFFGMSSAGLELMDKVYNSHFGKNVFTDIGFGAFVVGHIYHSDPDNNAWSGQWRDYRGVVSFRKGWTTSNQKSKKFAEAINTIVSNPESLAIHGVWKNEPNAAADGIKSWVKMDLGKEYNIHSVMLSFADFNRGTTSITTSEEERRNFEILVSNDKDFNTYETLAVQTDPVNETLTTPSGTSLAKSKLYESSLTGKYRYVMVRKTVAEAFAMSLMRVYSFDEKALGIFGLNKNNTFENNYISRIGIINNASPAITVFDTDGLKMLHNEIEDVPYSGLSIGYGWDNTRSRTSGNNEFRYNRISDVEKIASDGGAIYTTGNQTAYINDAYDTINKKPFEVTDNYIENQGNFVSALYCDSGSSHINFTNNVLQNGSAMIYAAGSRDDETIRSKYVNFRNIYTDDDYYKNGNSSLNSVENIVKFSAEQMAPEAISIKLNAGIESDAEYIKNRIPNNKSPFIVGPDAYSSYLAGGETRDYAPDKILYTTNVVNTMLNMGKFGNAPWQYDAKYKSQLEYWLGRISETPNRTDDVYASLSRNGFDITKSHMYEFLELDRTYKEAAASVNHLSYNDMLAMCRAKLDAVTTDEYSASAINEFSSAVSSAESADHSTKEREATVVYNLEEAYEALENGKKSADLLYAYAEDCETEIDYENKTATVRVPANVNAANVRPALTPMSNSSLVGDYSDTDFSKGAKVSLRNGTTTTEWTVKVVNKKITSSGNATIENSSEKWFSADPNSPVTVVGDGTRIQPWFTPTMYKDAFGGRVNFSAKVSAADRINGVNFIFGAKTCEDIEPEGYYTKNSFYMLSLKGQELILYKVESGVATEIARASDVGFNYNAYNNFEIKNAGGNVCVTLNDVSMFTAAASGALGNSGYFGVYTKASKVDIKPYDANLTNVAKGKYAYANWYYSNFAPKNMTDGDITTKTIICDFANLDTNKENAIYAYIDLGKAYNLTDVEVDFANGSEHYSGLANTYLNVYVTNNKPDGRDDLEKTKIAYTAGTNAQGTYIYNVDSGTPYRYILFEKRFSSGISISEVRAFSKHAIPSEYTADVSENKPIMGAVYSDNYELNKSQNATDDNTSTYFKGAKAGDTSKNERVIIDLKKGYNIDAFTLALNSKPSSGDIKFYLANDIMLSDKTLACTVSNAEAENAVGRILYVDVAEAVKTQNYRYVVIEKTTLGNFGINELEVLAKFGAEEIMDNDDNRVKLLSRGKSIISLDELAGYTPLNKATGEINDGNYAYSGYISSMSNKVSQNDQFVYIDLGEAYEIPYVALMTNKGYYSMNRAYQIVGSNVEPTVETEAENFTILYDGRNDNLNDEDDALRFYHTKPEYAGHKFRYIGVRKPYSINSFDTRIVLKELEVYGYVNNESEAELSVSLNGNILKVKANVELDQTCTYPVVIGGYTADKKMTNVIYSSIGMVDGQWKTENTYDISGFSSDTKVIRVYLFESIESIRPLCRRAEIQR